MQQVEVVTCCVDDVDCETDAAETDYTQRWCPTLTVIHVMLTIRSIINFNRRKCHKLKRKTKCII